MTSRRGRRSARRLKRAAAALAAVAGLAAGACDLSSSRAAAAAAYRGTVLAPPCPKPEFTLVATDGRAFHFRKETDGFATLLYFGHTHCPDVCPLTLASIAAALQTLPLEVAGRIKVVFVTTDPDRDSAGAIRAWLDAFNRGFIGLRSSLKEVNQIQAVLHEPAAMRQPLPGGGYRMGHGASVVAFSPDGLAHLLYPSEAREEDWAHDLPMLVHDRWPGSQAQEMSR